MSDNYNGLITTKQVAGSANIENSCYFVLNTDPVNIDTLSANEVIANNIVSGTVEVIDNINLNGGILTVSGGALELDGAPIGGGGSAAEWALYKAIQNVDMSGYKITKLGTPTDPSGAATKAYVDGVASGITPANWSQYPATSDIGVAGYQMNDVQFINAVTGNDNPVFIYNPYALGYSAPTSNALVVAGGDNRTDISNSGVGIATQKNITRGTVDYGAGETVGSLATFGKDTADNDIPYARVVGICTDPTTGTTLGRMNLGVRSGATNLIIAQLDASQNELSIQGNAGTRLNMNSKKIVNVPNPTDASGAANKAYVDTALTVSGGSAWSTFPATQNVNISGYKITGLANPTDASGAANKAYVDASGGVSWSAYRATQNVDMSGYKITNLGTPTDPSGAATKAYVDAITPANWSLYPALQTVSISGYDICGVTNIRGSVANAGKVVYPAGTIDMCGNGATLTLGQNIIYNRVTGTGSFPAGMAVNDPFTAGDANQTAYHFATLTTAITSAIFTMCRKGAFTNMFGVQGTAASNTFVIASQASATDFEFRRNVSIAPANLTGGTLLAQITRNGWFYLPTLSGGTAAAVTPNVLYYNSSNGSVTYGTIASSVGNWATYPAVQNVDMSGYSLTRVGGITNTSGTVAITGDDVNINCTGVTSILNVSSTLGTLISSVGAIDITAGGTTAINSTGNVTIGSLGTTSIENFNLNNSVLTKVPATSDLQLNNISQINNSSANIDISSTSVNLNKFQFSSTTLQAQGTNTLFLDDIYAVNNGAVGGRIDITASIVANNNFEFAGSQMASAGADFELNNIGTLNLTTAGSTIDSKATLQVSGTGLTDAVGFKTSILTSSVGDSIGVYVDQTTATATGGSAVGIYVAGTQANNTDGQAVGISVQTVLGGTGVGDYATGVEVAGSMTGTTKRGFYEHSATAGVVNTFVHNVGIGGDPNTSYLLDVSGGNARIANTAANPVSLLLENVEGGASANILRIYKNSSTPATNDVVGNLQFSGNNASGTLHSYANIQGAIQNATAGTEAGEMRLRATIASTATDFIHLDGSNSQVVINPGLNKVNFTVEDTSGHNLIYADASNQNVMMYNYPQRYIFDICNNYTLTLPNAFNTIRILAFGAGGGGGGGSKRPGNSFGGGAGAGGNGGEVWYDRRELLPDSSGSITLYITPGQGGAGGAGTTTAGGNGSNGSAGGATYVNLDTFGAAATKQLLTSSLCAGGNGGSGGTGTAGTGGTQASFTGDRNIGSQGRAGASSSTTGVPARNTTALLYNGSVYSQTGGSGAGGGIDNAGTSQFAGGIFVSPCGQKYNGLGANVNKGGTAGTAGGTDGGAGGIVSFDNLPNAAIRPPVGMGSVMAGGGASIGGNGGAGGGWTYGVAGSRGDGGGGGGAAGNASSATSGAGGRGADGFVYITVW